MPLQGLLHRNRISTIDSRRLSLAESLSPARPIDPDWRQNAAAPSRFLLPGAADSRLMSASTSDLPSDLSTTTQSRAVSTELPSNDEHLAPPEHSSRRHSRLSLSRFRHASDSHLSAKAKLQARPPVPATPAIITTAPTITVSEKSNKKRSRLTLPRMKTSSDARDGTTAAVEAPSAAMPAGSRINAGTSRATGVTFDVGSRPSLNGQPGPPPYGDESTSSLALPVSRLSESSRSEGSAGETIAYATTTTTHTISTTTTFFRLPRRKKNNPSLFPLPAKFQPAESMLAGGNNLRGDTERASGEAGRSPRINAVQNEQGFPSPVPSPSGSSQIPSGRTGAPGIPILRRCSTASVRSSQSSPSRGQGLLLGRKSRSPTMGSLHDASDDTALPTPPLPSGRNSTSTAGRSSLGGIFSLSHRLLQSTEAPYPRRGSPGLPSESASKANSFSLQREPLVIPEREPDDTPAKYLARLEEAVSRGAVAGVLSHSSDTFSQVALRSYMRSFAFFEDPMDMAIRKLLMDCDLPKETQQIDRVLQSFANRYHECNPGIYSSPDQAYFVAFSLLILHTDVFNKNNKHKMQKQDYLKNTRGEGISDDILECFYDNISYTPFIHVEDDMDINGDRIIAHKSKKVIFPRGSGDPTKKPPKRPVDPYTLIIDNKLDMLRPSLKDVMNLDDSYAYLGTAPGLDLTNLRNSFFKSGILQIVSARSRPDAFMSPATMTNPQDAHPGVVDVKVTKVGTLWRKEAKKKKARSPWQEWGAILTGSQLYFFRNTAWVKNLLHQYDAHQRSGQSGTPVIFKPPLESFKPDALISTDGAVALLDSSYKKHKHAFIFARNGTFEETFLADNEKEMNDWLAKLNFAASFRTAGVRMRGIVSGRHDGQPTRGIRRTPTESSSRSTKTTSGDSGVSQKSETILDQQIWAARRQIMIQKIAEADEKLSVAQKQLEGQLRNARHLQILAPIQAKTREQVILAAGRVAAQLKWVRMEMWRLICHKDILSLDLEEEHKEGAVTQAQGTAGGAPAAVPLRDSAAVSPGRLESSSTSQNSPKRAPLSPATMRPVTRDSSKEPEFGMKDIFQTPPELRRQSSHHATQPSWELPPLFFGSQTGGARDPNLGQIRGNTPPHDLSRLPTSASIRGSVRHSSVSDSFRLALVQSTVETDEAEVLKEAGLVQSTTGSPVAAQNFDGMSDSEAGKDESPMKLPDADAHDRSKVRRSLHRTLREAHVPAHHRSKKGRDSSAAASITDDGSSITESEGLARGTGSFTVHGKKASVINFGAEWQTMSPEERLKLRKQPLSEEGRANAALPDVNDRDDKNAPTSALDMLNKKEAFRNRTAAATTNRHSSSSEALGISGDERTSKPSDTGTENLPAESPLLGGKAESTDPPSSSESENDSDEGETLAAHRPVDSEKPVHGILEDDRESAFEEFGSRPRPEHGPSLRPQSVTA